VTARAWVTEGTLGQAKVSNHGSRSCASNSIRFGHRQSPRAGGVRSASPCRLKRGQTAEAIHARPKGRNSLARFPVQRALFAPRQEIRVIGFAGFVAVKACNPRSGFSLNRRSIRQWYRAPPGSLIAQSNRGKAAVPDAGGNSAVSLCSHKRRSRFFRDQSGLYAGDTLKTARPGETAT
jgi:hypothetical protein